MEWCPGCGCLLEIVGGRSPRHLRQTTAGWTSCPYGGRLWTCGCTAPATPQEPPTVISVPSTPLPIPLLSRFYMGAVPVH